MLSVEKRGGATTRCIFGWIYQRHAAIVGANAGVDVLVQRNRGLSALHMASNKKGNFEARGRALIYFSFKSGSFRREKYIEHRNALPIVFFNFPWQGKIE